MGLDEQKSSSRGFISQAGYVGAPGQIYPTPGLAYPQQGYSTSGYASSGYSQQVGYPFPSPTPYAGYGPTGPTMGGAAAGPYAVPQMPPAVRFPHSYGPYAGYSRDLE